LFKKKIKKLNKKCMKNYLIVGASSGIGKQLSEQLVKEGFQVFGTYCKNAIKSGDPNLKLYQLDVMSEQLSLDFVPEVLDGLVYCPGTINLRPFGRIKPEDFIQDYQLQVIGALKIIQAVTPNLKASTCSSVVLFSTVAVQLGLPFHAQVASSKGAIEGLTRSLAAEFAPKIRVNCIAPSLTDTPLAAALLNSPEKKEANALRHPLKRIGNPEDIANMAAFLLSDKSSWITGQIMKVDGGMSSMKV
jgi:NAD(P)-dependent dehydrogenase (short-subunit alcohol dehydrogenase family)